MDDTTKPRDAADEFAPDARENRRSYHAPRVTLIGTLAELTRGVNGVSDGLGPGSALG